MGNNKLIIEKSPDFNGLLQGRYEGDASAIDRIALDVYCEGSHRETLYLTKKDGTQLQSGPFRPCEKKLEIKPRLLPSGEEPVPEYEIVINSVNEIRAPIRPVPQPVASEDNTDFRKDMTELPIDQPLKVNTDKKHYFSRRSRAEGERDLNSLSRGNADREEAFIFVEGISKKDGKKISYWYEIGELETVMTDVDSSLKVMTFCDSDFTRAIQSEFRNVTGFSFYHFHPKDGTKQRGGEYPSGGDYSSIVADVMNPNIEVFGFPKEAMDYRVVTATGVFVFKPDIDLMRANSSIVENSVENYDQYFQFFINRWSGLTFRNTPQIEQNKFFLGAINKIAGKLMTIAFTPIE